jgi:hypothetical protein
MVTFFGETPSVSPGHVSTYHHWLLRLGIAVAVTFIVALWRRGSRSRWLYWHALVLLGGLFAALAFHVALEAPDPGPVQRQPRSACHSGGDNSGCVGG